MGSPEMGSLLGEDAVSREAVQVSSPKPTGKGRGCTLAVSPGSCCGTAVMPAGWESRDVGAGMLLNSLPSFGMC